MASANRPAVDALVRQGYSPEGADRLLRYWAHHYRIREEAILDLLAGLEVESIAELRRLVQAGRRWDETVDAARHG